MNEHHHIEFLFFEERRIATLSLSFFGGACLKCKLTYIHCKRGKRGENNDQAKAREGGEEESSVTI